MKFINLKKNLKMNIKVLGDRMIVKELGFQEEEIHGLKILKDDRERARRGKVIKAGPGLDGQEMTYKEGDTVLYGKTSGIPIRLEEEDFLIMRECDAYAAIEE